MQHFVTHTPDLIITCKDTHLEVLDFEMGAGLENSAYYCSKKIVHPCYITIHSLHQRSKQVKQIHRISTLAFIVSVFVKFHQGGYWILDNIV